MNEDQARALIHLAGPDGSGAGDFDATLSTVLRRGRRHLAVRRGLAISGSALATATLVLVPLFLRAQPAEHLGPAAPPLPPATSTTTPTVTGTTHTPPPPGTAPVSTTSHAPASPGFSPTDDGLSPTSTP